MDQDKMKIERISKPFIHQYCKKLAKTRILAENAFPEEAS